MGTTLSFRVACCLNIDYISADFQAASKYFFTTEIDCNRPNVQVQIIKGPLCKRNDIFFVQVRLAIALAMPGSNE